jgi:hypothetical protein
MTAKQVLLATLFVSLPLASSCDATPKAANAQQPTSASGRYQVVDGGAATGYRMLLDTQTGRTWNVCRDTSAAPSALNWCQMQINSAPASAKIAP